MGNLRFSNSYGGFRQRKRRGDWRRAGEPLDGVAYVQVEHVGYGHALDPHREDRGVVTTVIDVPKPPNPPFSPQLTKQIHDVTGQVVRIVG